MQKLVLILVDAIEKNQDVNLNLDLDMGSSYLNRRILYILLFYFSTFSSQKVTIINNTGGAITADIEKKESIISDQRKMVFPTVTQGIAVKNDGKLNKFIDIFLEPAEKIEIIINSDNTITYSGDKAEIQEYINEKLNVETFGKINIYQNAVKKKDLAELTRSSEFVLLNIMKNIKVRNILASTGDTDPILKMKIYVKYNWLSTILSIMNTKEQKQFTEQAINYYYRKYIEPDVKQFKCNDYYQYRVIEFLAKNTDLLYTKLPTYPIVEHTDADSVNQFLPKSCQKLYFQSKYDYLEHVNGHNKEYYKKVLTEKFNDQ